MTTPSDIAGLSERLEWLSSPLAEGMSEYQRVNAFVQISGEVKTALDSLSARVKELEAELSKIKHGDGWRAFEDARTELGRIIEDEYEGRSMWPRLHRVRIWWDGMKDRADTLQAANGDLVARAKDMDVECCGLTARALRAEQQRDEAYERAATAAWEAIDPSQEGISRTCAEEAVNAIRRLASGPEGGEKHQESKP